MTDVQIQENTPQENLNNEPVKNQVDTLKSVVLEINGKKVEMSAEEFEKERRKVQLHKAATDKFNKASEKEKFADEILQLFKAENFSEKSLRELAKKNNISKETLLSVAEKIIGDDIEYERMSDIEKENYELKMKIKEKEEFEQQEKERNENRRLVLEITKARQEFITELQKLEDNTFLNLFDPEIFSIVKGQYVRHNGEISLSDAVEIVEEQYKRQLDNQKPNKLKLKTMLQYALKDKGLDEKDIEALINGGAKAFRERLIEKTKESAANPFTPSLRRNVNQEKPATPKVSAKEFFRNIKYQRNN